MPNKIKVLELFLHNQPIGTITRLPDDRNIFAFNQEYIHNPSRATLSLSFKDKLGNLLSHTKTTQTRLPPFFANVLPEGFMRSYLAAHAKVNPDGEFFLLAALGHDLPGAIKTVPLTYVPAISSSMVHNENTGMEANRYEMHFSLTGFQLKFPATLENKNRLTIPVRGTGGSWIIKLPSPLYKDVPQNEYSMMELARRIGIDVPKTALISLDNVKGLPSDIEKYGSHAFAIKRFDRDEQGGVIHSEDFAQVFAVYPEKKYHAANYRNIAQVIWIEVGPPGLTEFIRRIVFTALIGNGDMHLKNWSLIYPDKKNPQLAPAYDFLSTLPYLPQDSLALNFLHSKAFNSLTLDHFEHFASSARLPKKLVLDIVTETVGQFAHEWQTAHSLPLDEKVVDTISSHLKKLPLWVIR